MSFPSNQDKFNSVSLVHFTYTNKVAGKEGGTAPLEENPPTVLKVRGSNLITY
jgi:hypothetical protein